MNPSAVASTFDLGQRSSSALARVSPRPTLVLEAREDGLPVLVYVSLTDREDLVRVRTVNLRADLEVEGLYDRDRARLFVKSCLSAGFTKIGDKT